MQSHSPDSRPPVSQSPVFVVGSMRSGSTLFRLILDAHPHIAISEETGFMGALAATKAIPNWRYGREWYGRVGWSEEELDSRLRAFYAGMFERYAAGQGKRRWGEKTPFHSRHIPAMARVFPQAVFVGIVRHPGAVVSSLMKSFHYGVQEAADYWESTNIDVLREGAALGDERFALLRYEDLVRNPEPTLRELMVWLGEPWSDDLLRHQDVQVAKGAPRLVDGSTSTRDPIKAARADKWVDTMSAADREVVTATTGDLAGFLGYEPGGATRPMSSENGSIHRMLLTGTELARMQHQSRGTISFTAREEAIVVAEMGTEELVNRLRQAERSLERIRSRPIVRLNDSVRRFQRKLSVGDAARRLAAPLRRGRVGPGA